MDKEPTNKNGETPVNTPWDSLADEDFQGERNINDKTGKTRTFSEFDLYPRMKGETSQEYGERLRWMHQKLKEFEAETSHSEETSAGAESAAREELETQERERIEAEERQKLDTEEETIIDVYEKPIDEMTPEELDAAEAETQRKIDQIKAELAELEQPLVAINADFSYDEKELAHDFAEQDLNEEVAKSGLIKRLWKGTLFKKYYEKKYTNEYISGKRSRDGKDIHELTKEQSKSTMERFVLGATEDAKYIHEKAGEKLEKADAETTEKVRSAIEKFATAKIPEGGTIEDLKLQFMEDIGRSEAEASDQGKKIDKKLIDNYLEVAIQARMKVEHEIAIDKVMDGFAVYNAEVRDGIRTQAHRDNIDKIVNFVQSSRVGQFIPEEILAGAVGVAVGLTQTGARAVAGVAGGIVASGAVTYLKERNRITEDRARMQRDAANGLVYSGMSDEEVKNLKGHAKKIAKYEKRIGGTLYDLQKASSLTSNIEAALSMEPGEERDKALLKAVAEARVRIDFSDSEQKDLIAYSSEDKRGEERLALDKAVIQAEKILSKDKEGELEALKEHLENEIENGVDEKDKNFKHERTLVAMKKASKTMLIGVGTFLGSQEIMAVIDPNKIGVFEKAGLIKTSNNENATETLIASGFGFNRGVVNSVNTSEPIKVNGNDEVAIERLEANGYTKTEVSGSWTEQQNQLVDIDPASSTAALKVKYDGWANNGTLVSDGNELSAYIQNGQFVSGMNGASTMGSEVLDYNTLASAGKIKGYLTIGGAKFEIASSVNSAGQLTWGSDGVFTTTTGETIRAIGDNGEKLYKYFEIAVDNGVDANGIQHIVPLATDVGANSFSGTMQQVVSTTIKHPPVYEFIKTTETVSSLRDIATAGIAITPETARTGLGGTRAASETPTPTPENPTPTGESPAQETPTSSEPEAPVTEETSPRQPETTTPQESPTPEQSSQSPEGSAIEQGEERETPAAEQSELGQSGQTLVRLIENSRANLGGDEGVQILTDMTPFNESNIERYNNWWSSLGDDDKNMVRMLMNIMNTSDTNNTLPIGRGFRTWFNSSNI